MSDTGSSEAEREQARIDQDKIREASLCFFSEVEGRGRCPKCEKGAKNNVHFWLSTGLISASLRFGKVELTTYIHKGCLKKMDKECETKERLGFIERRIEEMAIIRETVSPEVTILPSFAKLLETWKEKACLTKKQAQVVERACRVLTELGLDWLMGLDWYNPPDSISKIKDRNHLNSEEETAVWEETIKAISLLDNVPVSKRRKTNPE